MFNCTKDVICYHNDEVTLPQSDRSNMRKRRNSNRDRLKSGLTNHKDPQPFMFCKQGSYAMLTMVQHDNNDYDIDDGVYFEKADLDGKRGGEMSALDARKMVRDAIDDGSFKTAPVVKNNCVRIFYTAGYHVDMPTYRHRIEKDPIGNDVEVYEIASSDWKRSDARLVTDWFNEENIRQSPDGDNGRQLRRITRLIKKYAKSRPSWCAQIASGFAITKLVTECYSPNVSREDTALRDTMRGIRDRLQNNLVVKHPTTPNETISKGDKDPKLTFLMDKLTQALDDLTVLDKQDCKRAEALAAWDKVYATDYFSLRCESESESNKSASILNAGIVKSCTEEADRSPVRKQGGGTFA